ncbi:MAG: S41 family peptidase [Candidatus Spechtbacterales bacterium]
MKPVKQKPWLRFSIAALALAVTFFVGFSFGTNASDSAGTNRFSDIFTRSGTVDFALVEKVWDALHSQHVDRSSLDDEALVYGAIRGMLEGLDDPYTTFFTEQEANEFFRELEGSFEGVGIEIDIRDGVLVVVSPLRDSPAQRAGVRAGDAIVAIDGASTQDITLEEAVTKIRGEQGTTITLTVRHGGDSTAQDIRITRDVIEIPSVEMEVVDGRVAYISVNHFSENMNKEFSAIAQAILSSNADRVVLDVRNNPGGLLQSSINLAGWFIPKGDVILIEELADGTRKEFRSAGPGSLQSLPLVIVQNEGSASASEILAGALHEQRGAAIVGAKSFGKGSVQEFLRLPGGTGIKLTVARWLTPEGNQIAGMGITPTHPVEQDEDPEDEQREAALNLVNSL